MWRLCKFCGGKGMIQGTSEWHEWRKKGIGSSDAPAIMGTSPYHTPFTLWQIKTGKKTDQASSFATELGQKFEPAARADLELKTGFEFTPSIGVHEAYDWLRASYDGLCEKERVFDEIKWVGSSVFQSVKDKGEIPSAHYDQIQHQFMVSGYEKAFYTCYRLTSDYSKIEEIYHCEVFKDENRIKQIWESEQEFWFKYVLKNEPPPLTKDDVIDISTSDAIEIAKAYEGWLNSYNRSKDAIAELKPLLFSLSDHARISVGNLLITDGKGGRRITIRKKGDKNV